MANNTRITLFFYLHLVLIAFYSCCVVYPHLGLKIDVLATVLVHSFSATAPTLVRTPSKCFKSNHTTSLLKIVVVLEYRNSTWKQLLNREASIL
jgi:hypothetical protein